MSERGDAVTRVACLAAVASGSERLAAWPTQQLGGAPMSCLRIVQPGAHSCRLGLISDGRVSRTLLLVPGPFPVPLFGFSL